MGEGKEGRGRWQRRQGEVKGRGGKGDEEELGGRRGIGEGREIGKDEG